MTDKFATPLRSIPLDEEQLNKLRSDVVSEDRLVHMLAKLVLNATAEAARRRDIAFETARRYANVDPTKEEIVINWISKSIDVYTLEGIKTWEDTTPEQ